MIANQVGQRYAKAIYEIACARNEIKEIYSVLNNVMELYINDKEFKTVITDPLIDVEAKQEIIEKIFHGTPKTTLDIIYYIIQKQRIGYIRNIVAEYLKIYYKEHRILDVFAIFATEPSEAQKDKLIKNLEHKTGKKIKLQVRIDKSIIGGGILRIGDQVIDGSIRGELEKIKQTEFSS